MNIQAETRLTGVIVDETTSFTFSEVCTHCNIPREILEQMLEYGILENVQFLQNDYQIDLKYLKLIEVAFRLYRDLEINIAGISIILELKREVAELRTQLNLLQPEPG